ncbi:zinc-dependent alcohol dehydrogenase family protein [Nocardia sp. CDC160]|uniref:zinc-dependent alcohol dehydrogenase family protein n=1 Tax=Nocardia sp. CDC160 TaxID=3112166 RepID=UPI002DB6A3D3|nr:zinc-dependent alcohol dehydrogenase family protein [Nocardia sp. CDC160]MEC3917642.1 zinc-dependent alcohol dehydrogenase family protein [Nocardia sp. CDC160]
MLQIDRIPIAEPVGNEVRVRVEAVALNRADTLWRAGKYIEEPELPARIGYDFAGTVEAVGPEVERLRVGAKVSSFPIESLRKYGNHADVTIYPEDGLIEYPNRFSPEEAAAVNTGLFTAYFPIVEVARVSAGQHVLLTAGSSTTAQAAAQIAKSIGATTIATTRTGTKVERLLHSGFDHVIVTEQENVTERVLELTGGVGARLVYDAVAGPGLEDLAWATAPQGHLVVYGALGIGERMTPLPLMACFARTIKLYAGYKIYDFTGHPGLGIARDRDATERAKRFVLGGLAAGTLRPSIDRIFHGLDAYRQAHEYMEADRHAGKIVISLR